MRALCLFLVLSACSSPATDTADDVDTEADTTPASSETLTLTARDGVSLVADRFDAEGTAGVVLLHMTPSGPWNRSDWPDAFVQSLVDDGISVVRIDRRGAGESGGEAEDAYLGEAGRYDVEAAVGALTEVGVTRLMLVGASNGSTSLLDYAVWAPGEGLPSVQAFAMMSPGTYTENQNAISALADVPGLLQFPANEATWPTELGAETTGGWTLTEYAGDAHGTNLFAADDAVATELHSFLVLSAGG